jgi:hypothetical protein
MHARGLVRRLSSFVLRAAGGVSEVGGVDRRRKSEGNGSACQRKIDGPRLKTFGGVRWETRNPMVSRTLNRRAEFRTRCF